MNVEPGQGHESVPEAEETSTKARVSSRRGLLGDIAKLMGKTAGLAQNTGAKTADGIFAAGRRAGKLLRVRANLRSMVAYGTKKKREKEFDFEIERLARRIERLYARIGERICHSPLFDRSLLPMDPQLEALVATVRELEFEVHDLHDQARFVAEESGCPRHGASESAAKRGLSCTTDSQVSESNEPAPLPALKEGEAQLSEAE